MKTLTQFSLIVLSFFSTTQLFSQSILVNAQNNTSCGIPNGSLSASVDGETVGYTFAWYSGVDLTGSLLSMNSFVPDLPGGIYTVNVTLNSNGSSVGITSAVVLDEQTTSEVTIEVVSHLTSCVSPNGILRAVVQGIASDYTYAWYQGSDVFSVPIFSGSETVDQLPAGTYSVLVTNNNSFCSTVATATIVDDRVLPNVNIVVSNVTSCSLPDGALSAIVEGLVSDYSFEWHEGPDIFSGPILSVSETVDQLPAGTYSVLVTNNNSFCSAVASATIADEAVQPVVYIEVSNNTSCSLPNGALTALTDGPLYNYTFQWFEGPFPFSGTLLSVNSTVDFLMSGIYTVVVTNNNTGCESIVSAVVLDETIVPNVSIEVVSDNTSCAQPNGVLTALVEGPVFNYNFRWFEGSFFGGPVLSMSPTAEGLSAGFYSVLVEDLISGCVSVAYAEILDACEFVSGETFAAFITEETGQISYYPNPTSGILNIKSETSAGRIVIMDQNGNVIGTKNLSTSKTPYSFDLSAQPAGRYILTFTSGVSSTQYHIIKE